MAGPDGSAMTGRLVWWTLLGVAFCVSACNTGTAGSGNPPPPPTIAIKSMSTYYGVGSTTNLPYAIAGLGSFQLLVNGTGFSNSSVVEWNANALPTQFADNTDLVASVSNSLIAAPGKATITVVDSGIASNPTVLPIASSATTAAGVVALVSAASDGSPANGDSLVLPSISATGRYIAFQSNATNLVAGTTSNQYQQIYERDTCIGAPSGCTPSTTLISAAPDGSPANDHSRTSSISADGRYVAFDTQSTNLLPGASICGPPNDPNCVFLRDTCIGAPDGCAPTTIPVSTTAQGTVAPGSGPQMSPDARYITFVSSASALGLGSTTVGDVFVRDTCIGALSGCIPSTNLASVPSDGSNGNENSEQQGISSNGRFLAFLSWATNMVPQETVTPGIFWRDTCLGAGSTCSAETARADVADTNIQANAAAQLEPFPGISGDGRLVAFGSDATNLVATNVNADCATNTCAGVYVRDTCAGAGSGCSPSTSLVSVANDGSMGNCSSPGNAGGISISADGRFVAFGSIATNLTPDDTFTACGWEDIFVRDTCFGVSSGCVPSTVRVSVANKPNPGISANAINTYSVISADGHYVVFLSPATNLLSGLAANGHQMVWLARTGF